MREVTYVELAVVVKHVTEKALLCDFGDGEAWVPKSILGGDTDVEEKGDSGVVSVPEWFAEKEELV